MRLGMHEMVDMQEMLSAKINAIDHHALYIAQCRDPQLRSILERHQSKMTQDYEAALNFLQGRGANVAPYRQRQVGGEGVRYGMQNAPAMQPHPEHGRLSDQAIAQGALNLHKCGAVSSTRAALEAADPELRSMLSNGILSCINMAYELFQFMNQKGWYAVPLMDQNMMNRVAHSFHPPAGHVQGRGVGPMEERQAGMTFAPQTQTGYAYHPGNYTYPQV
ncbi:MAG: spore coat protein [Peptococcaceae bacterium]|nr:spore coat protein [Peptococcaceae bacterium]